MAIPRELPVGELRHALQHRARDRLPQKRAQRLKQPAWHVGIDQIAQNRQRRTRRWQSQPLQNAKHAGASVHRRNFIPARPLRAAQARMRRKERHQRRRLVEVRQQFRTPRDHQERRQPAVTKLAHKRALRRRQKLQIPPPHRRLDLQHARREHLLLRRRRRPLFAVQTLQLRVRPYRDAIQRAQM